MQTVGFITRRDLFFRHESRAHLFPYGISFFIYGKIIDIGFLEKASLMGLFTGRTIILYRKHPMSRWAILCLRKLIICTAMRTRTMAPTGRPLKRQPIPTGAANPGAFPINGFREFAAKGTYENIFRMPSVFGKEKSGEEIKIFSALTAGLNFYPKEILDVGFS